MQPMKTVLAAAAVSLCLAFAGHTAELRPAALPSAQDPGCIPHDFLRVSDTRSDQTSTLGCAQFLATSRVVQPRHIQRT